VIRGAQCPTDECHGVECHGQVVMGRDVHVASCDLTSYLGTPVTISVVFDVFCGLSIFPSALFFFVSFSSSSSAIRER
jgi:hypothetical protein